MCSNYHVSHGVGPGTPMGQQGNKVRTDTCTGKLGSGGGPLSLMVGGNHSQLTSACLDVQHGARVDEQSQAVNAWRRKVQLPASGHPDSQGELCHPP